MNPQTGQSEIPPFTIQMDLDLTWQRKPDRWGFIGRLNPHQILNPETLSHGPWIDRFPDLALAIPLMTEISAIEVAGGLRPSRKEASSWRLAVTDSYSERYTCDLGINTSHWPWSVTASLGPFVVAYQDIAPLFMAKNLPPAIGEIDVQQLLGSGRLGDWKNWNLNLQAKASFESLTIPKTGHQFHGLTIEAGMEGKINNWTGKASLVSQRTEGAPLTQPLRGLSLQDMEFALSEGGIEIKGPYAVEEVMGSAWSGNLAYTPKGDYRLDGTSKKLDLSPFNTNMTGVSEATFDLQGNIFDNSDPQLGLKLSSKSFRWGKYDFSARPLVVQLAGKIVEGRNPRWSSADITWGTALQVGMRDCELKGDRLGIGGASLSGDMRALQELIPGLQISPSFQEWVNPKDWRLDGGIAVTLKPSFSLSIEEGIIDTGRGIKGPIEFVYQADTSQWTFRSPTLHFDLAKLLKEYKIDPVQAEGSVTLNLSLVGRIPVGNNTTDWIQSGTINGRLASPTGQIRNPFPQPAGQPAWFTWKDLSGPFEVQINSKSRRLTGSLSANKWVFITIPPSYKTNYQKTLETQAKIGLTISSMPGEAYRVQELNVVLGDSTPVRILSQGTITKTPEGWSPDLKVKGEVDGGGVTPVYRGVQIGGTGVFVGDIKGNKRGNWILDGDLECSGLRFEQVAIPVVLTNVRGTFYLRDVYLDEILSRNRWLKRKHEFPPNPDQPDSLDKAFGHSGSPNPTLTISAARIGSSLYRALSLRTILIGETLYLNTVMGSFSEGDYPLRATGFVFYVPGRGAGWRVRGETRRVPLSLGVPGMFDKMIFREELVDVTFYLTRTPPGDKVQTRYLSLGFPIGRLRDIPAVGSLLFGWTPDSLNSTDLIVQKVGEGDWQLLNPFQLPEATAIPKFILMDLPRGVFERVQRGGRGFLQGVGEGIEDFIWSGD